MIKNAIWTPDGVFSKYSIDDEGNVYSHAKKHPKILKHDVGKFGYHRVTLAVDERCEYHRYLVHRLVLWNFANIPNSEEYQVDHIDGDKSNNRLSNLRWVTASENMIAAFEMGLVDSSNNGKYRRTFGETETDDMLTDIFLRGKSADDVCPEYGISKRYFKEIRKGRTRQREVKEFLERHSAVIIMA